LAGFLQTPFIKVMAASVCRLIPTYRVLLGPLK
jgi:hypothetical protein